MDGRLPYLASHRRPPWGFAIWGAVDLTLYLAHGMVGLGWVGSLGRLGKRQGDPSDSRKLATSNQHPASYTTHTVSNPLGLGSHSSAQTTWPRQHEQIWAQGCIIANGLRSNLLVTTEERYRCRRRLREAHASIHT